MTFSPPGVTSGVLHFMIVPPVPMLTALTPQRRGRVQMPVSLSRMLTRRGVANCQGEDWADAVAGERTVTVTTQGETSSSQKFAVLPPVPTLTAIDPGSSFAGDTVAAIVLGSGY